MTPTLIRIATAGLLSLASLFVILFQVSPLSAPGVAVPFFFLTVFLSSSSIVTLVCYFIWNRLSIEGMDAGRKLSLSFREGIMFAIATVLILLFLLLEILTWWIAVLMYLVFFLVEMALLS